MKYKIDDMVYTKQDLKRIYDRLSQIIHITSFEVWLLGEIESGAITEVEDDYVGDVVICVTKDRTTGLYNFETKNIQELSQEERNIYKDDRR